MQYIGLVSVVVGVTNLIPTVGPIVGWVIGAFILLMVDPLHALIFLIFSLILQSLDSYVIKPKLFGNSLGVSGLLILVSIVIGGRIFGMVGIILAIPFVAICDYTFKEIAIPWLESKRKAKGKPALEEFEADTSESAAEPPPPEPEKPAEPENKPEKKKNRRK
jgi:predicted PurR-regulated permease PerM